MSVNKIELNQLKSDVALILQNLGSPNNTALEALKVIELRRLNSNLEYLSSIMEHAPWNIKSE